MNKCYVMLWIENNSGCLELNWTDSLCGTMWGNRPEKQVYAPSPWPMVEVRCLDSRKAKQIFELDPESPHWTTINSL